MGESYFVGLTDIEKEEAWNFLVNGFSSSVERITGLYHLDQIRAVSLFKEAIELPIATSSIPAKQEALESTRLLMLKYINRVEPDRKYIAAMCEFSKSRFVGVRTEFAQALPSRHVTPEAVEALKGMVFTETETLALSSAISKLMLMHGLDFDRKDPVYKAIYLLLRSDDPKEKKLLE